MKKKIKEDVLLKALADVDATLAKSEGQKRVDGKPGIPSTTHEANGALSDEGDDEELAAKSQAALDEYARKAMASDEDEDDEEEEDDEETSKSMSDEDEDDEEEVARGNPRARVAQIAKSQLGVEDDQYLDGAPFLDGIVDEVCKSEKALRKSVQGFRAEQTEFNETMSKAMAGVCKMVVKLNEKLDAVMSQPAGARKSVVHKSEVNERFGGPGDGQPNRFNEGQVKKALLDLWQAGKVQALDVSRYDSARTMPPEVQQVVVDHLQKSVS